MKKLICLLALILVSYANLSACDISFKVMNNAKAKYKAGDELVAKVTVVLTHRNCKQDIGKTELVPDGVQILSATKWSEVGDNTYERKLKIKVAGNKKGKASIKAIRKCNKDGGEATLQLAMGK